MARTSTDAHVSESLSCQVSVDLTLVVLLDQKQLQKKQIKKIVCLFLPLTIPHYYCRTDYSFWLLALIYQNLGFY
jgi:hypothetical protein